MNTPDKPPASILAISRASYRGVPIFETGDDVRIYIGQKEYVFKDLSEVTAFIDATMALVVTIH